VFAFYPTIVPTEPTWPTEPNFPMEPNLPEVPLYKPNTCQRSCRRNRICQWSQIFADGRAAAAEAKFADGAKYVPTELRQKPDLPTEPNKPNICRQSHRNQIFANGAAGTKYLPTEPLTEANICPRSRRRSRRRSQICQRSRRSQICHFCLLHPMLYCLSIF
jgi:hypothetical protein